MPFLKKDAVPGITSPETMIDSVDFFLVSSHGGTNLKRLMIVPENTFLVFLGQSGFIRNILDDTKRYIQLMNPIGYLPPGIALRRTDPVYKNAEKEWSKALYENYFEGTSKSLQFYPNAMIYGPGDILPDTELEFASGVEQEIWHKGVYSLPIAPAEVRNFTLERPILYLLADLYREGRITPYFINEMSKLKAAKRGDFYAMVFLDDAARRAAYGSEPRVKDYFDDTTHIEAFIDVELFYRVEGNLASGAPLNGAYLSDTLYETKSAKPYRFFFFTGCRGLQYGDEFKNVNAYRGAEPRNITANVQGAALRRTMRRFSLSSKCSIGKKPPMNFGRIREKFVAVLADSATLERVAAMRLQNVVALMQFMANFFDRARKFTYVSYVDAYNLAYLLNFAYERIPAEIAREVPKVAEFLEEIRDTFSEFMARLRRNANGNSHGKSPGEFLLERMGYEPSIVSALFPISNAHRRQAAIEGEAEIQESMFQKGTDEIFKKYGDSYAAFRDSIKEYVNATKKKLEALRKEDDGSELRQDVEANYLHYKRLGEVIRSEFEREHTDLFFVFGHLNERQKEYRMADGMELMEQTDEFKNLLKPLQRFINRLVNRTSA